MSILVLTAFRRGPLQQPPKRNQREGCGCRPDADTPALFSSGAQENGCRYLLDECCGCGCGCDPDRRSHHGLGVTQGGEQQVVQGGVQQMVQDGAKQGETKRGGVQLCLEVG